MSGWEHDPLPGWGESVGPYGMQDVRRFGEEIAWDYQPPTLTVAADRTLESAVQRMRREGAAWIVVIRPTDPPETCRYVFRTEELDEIAENSPDYLSLSLEEALSLREREMSHIVRGMRLLGTQEAIARGYRFIEVDPSESIVAIGELRGMRPHGLLPKGGVSTRASEDEDFIVIGEVDEDAGVILYEEDDSDDLVPDEGADGAVGTSAGDDLSDLAELGSGLGTFRGGTRGAGGGEAGGAGPGRPVPRMVGEVGSAPPPTAPASAAPSPGSGGSGSAAPPLNGGGSGTSGGEDHPEAAAPPETVAVTLSAHTRAEIQVGTIETVDFRIELTEGAAPLAESAEARAQAEMPIVVSLSTENDALEILREREHTIEPPTAAERARTNNFLVRAKRPGVVRLAVTFRQGGTDLGVIGLAVEVIEAQPRPEAAEATTVASPRDPADDDKLALLIEQRIEDGKIYYEYILHSEALGLDYLKRRSANLLDRGDGPAKSLQDYVGRIYDSVTRKLKSFDDLKELQREARALGASLCRELFHPEVARQLWPLRNRFTLIQVVSWEPYIPWELVRLEDPETGEIDEKFLAEYGLVRTLSDQMHARELPMNVWGYLGARFPEGTYPSVGAELGYFAGDGAGTLRAHGIAPVAIEPTRDALYDALADGEFDVLHLACHAESAHDAIDHASLVIADEPVPGNRQARLVVVDTTTVEAEARLKARRPLVFLNACETGRVGAVLTAWGGWPKVFLRAGAGAFVGSSWAVRDKPAATFATTFYNALLDGTTLSEAATVARAEAKKAGDVSWLAFKVYGHPRARRKG